MNHILIGYVLMGITIFYQRVLIASIDSLSLIDLCLILFDICYIVFV